MLALTDGENDVTAEKNGLVFTTHKHDGKIKVTHCQRSNGRIGRAICIHFGTEAEANRYIDAYAGAN